MILRLQNLTFLLALISATQGLQPSDIPADTPVSSLISTAKSHLANGSPRDALVYFDAAISRDPRNYLTIFQRGATYLSLGKSSKASEDFDRVLQLKPDFGGALIQRARIKAKSADWAGAKKDLKAAGKEANVELEELEEARAAAGLAEVAEISGDWESCVSQAGVAILKASSSSHLRQLRARCRLERGEVQEGISDLGHVLQLSPGLIEPHIQISSMLFYSLGDTERGVVQARRCLHSDPDSKVCGRLHRRQRQISKRLDSLSNFLEKRKFNKAAELLVGASDDSGLIQDVKDDVEEARAKGDIHSKAPNKLYTDLVERACEVYREMGLKRKAQPFCTEALTLNPGSLHGLLAKAQAQIDADEFEPAIHTLNTANQHHPGTAQIQSLLQKAHMLHKRSKQKDYYKVLGVDREADAATIKRAYRKQTKQYHPDKAPSQGISPEEASKKMTAINEAYEVLSTPELKDRYDRGEDPNDPQSQGGQPFYGSPFGPGSGGPQFFFQQGGGGGPQFKFSGGFPFG